MVRSSNFVNSIPVRLDFKRLAGQFGDAKLTEQMN